MKLIAQAGIAFIAILFCSTLAEAQQQHIGNPPTGHQTWRNSNPDGTSIDVTYFINPGFSPNQVSLIRQAAGAWSNAGALVRLVEVPAAGDITVTNFAFLPQGVFFGPFNPAPNHPDGHTSREITSAGINMNPGASPWHDAFPLTPAGAGELDFYSFILREFGTALGLGNANLGTDPGSVMDPTIGLGEMRRNLSTADMQSLQILYGAPEPATMALFGMGLAALCLSRVRRKPAR